jgi:hypothetical protein
MTYKFLFASENAMNATLRNLFCAAAFAALSVITAVTYAQTGFGSAGHKQGIDAYWPGRATTQYLQSAQSYAAEFQAHVARAGQPAPAVVHEVNKTLTGYLDEANKHLAAMKKDFAKDTETVAAIETIEKDLAKAVADNKAMITCCQDKKFDQAMAMTCCTDLSKSLAKIHAAHVALMGKLAVKYPPQTTTAATK